MKINDISLPPFSWLSPSPAYVPTRCPEVTFGAVHALPNFQGTTGAVDHSSELSAPKTRSSLSATTTLQGNNIRTITVRCARLAQACNGASSMGQEKIPSSCRCTHWGSTGGIIGGEGCPDR
jgi:hypothetical protein